jgi:hypothetical protein
MHHEIANNGSLVSIMNIVTGLKVVNREAFVLFPARARGFSLLQTMQIEYGAHRFYYSMYVGDNEAEE